MKLSPKLVKIVGSRVGATALPESLDAASLDVDGALGNLYAALNEQKRLLRDHQPQFLEQRGDYDGIGDTSLVFEGDEHDPMGCA